DARAFFGAPRSRGNLPHWPPPGAEPPPGLPTTTPRRVILQNVSARIVEPMADAARQRALDHEKGAASPGTPRTPPVSLTAAARALLTLDLDLLLRAIDAQDDGLAREAAVGRAGRGCGHLLCLLDEPYCGVARAGSAEGRDHAGEMVVSVEPSRGR